jgi:hypothetical protein
MLRQRTRPLGTAGITTGRTTGDLHICVHESELLVGIDGSMALPFRPMTAQQNARCVTIMILCLP